MLMILIFIVINAEEFMMDTNGKLQEIWEFSECWCFFNYKVHLSNYAIYYSFPISILFWKITAL